MLKPLEILVESGIWKRNCAGIAIFYKNKTVKIFSIDGVIPLIEVVGENFFTEPLQKTPSDVREHIIDTLKQMDNKEREFFVTTWQ